MANTGRCHCGEIRYELDCEIETVLNCHCRDCRRAHGAAFITEAIVPSSAFRLSAGEASLAQHGQRFFCRTCGTRLFNRTPLQPEIMALMVASLDEEPTLPPVMHLNVESKAPWYEILDDRPQYAAFPKGFPDAGTDRR